MDKLDLERLARLIDETPTLEELEELEGSEELRAELKALREQTEALGSLPDLRPPVGDWSALKTRLASEGLIRSDAPAGTGMRSFGSSGWMRAAAAVVLFLGGMWVGNRAGFGAGDPATFRAGLDDGSIPIGQVVAANDRDEAERAVEVAQSNLMAALVQYQQFIDDDAGAAVVVDESRKFLALEDLIGASQRALELAPADPFINGMLVNAFAEREALLRNVSTSSSSGSWY